MSVSISTITRPARRIVRSVKSGNVNEVLETVRHGVAWRVNRMKRARARTRLVETQEEPLSAAPAPVLVDLRPAQGPGASAPIVSVVVTTLNRQDLLPVALRSIQLQDLEEWECIVVDDGSTDDTVEVARLFMDRDDRFRVVRHATRMGLPAARNTGVAHARADLVCFLDDDDFLLDGSLSKRVGALEDAPPDVVGSFCDWINTDPHEQLEVFKPLKKPRRRGQITFATLRTGPPFIATSPLLRRRAVLEAGGFDETFARAEDSEFWHRLLRLGYRFIDARHVGVAYRRSPGSMVLGNPIEQIKVLREIEEMADRSGADLEGFGPRPVTEPLSSLAAEGLRAPMVYRYLAMIAVDDVDRAVEMGRAMVAESVRAEIDPLVLTRELINYVKGRCSVRQTDQLFRLESATYQLVSELLPPIAQTWKSSVDIGEWMATRRARSSVEGGTPTVVRASSEAVKDAVVLVVEAKYHVDELGPLSRELEGRGRRVCWMLSPKTVESAKAAIGSYSRRVVEFDVDAIAQAAAVVVLNDWGPARDLIERANEAGVPTFAKVEGVQDFDDVDTGRVRRPYRTASVVLAQGTNDREALPDKHVEVVGSSRLERIWNAAPVRASETVLVNLNFTYHVLTEHREAWMESIVRATDVLGVRAVVSAHPADRTRNVGLPFVDRPFRHAITEAGVLISRFSTVPFEAMARGVPFVYHNPHRELVPTFTQPKGAFEVTTGVDDLAAAIERALEPDPNGRERFASFFLDQVDVLSDRSSEARTADVILGRIP